MKELWTQNVEMPRFAPLRYDLKTDVLIIGGGLSGLLCAHKLQQAGVDYALIEARTVGCGTSGHSTAKITAQHGLCYQNALQKFGAEKAQMLLMANLNALEQYRDLAQELEFDFEEKDNYIYSSDPQKLEQELEALQTIGYSADLVRHLPLPIEAAGAVRFSRQAQCHPMKLMAGLAKGLHIYEKTPARSFHGMDVITDGGNIAAQKIIFASHFPLLNACGGYFIKLYQHRSYVSAWQGAPLPDGMFMGDTSDAISFRSYGDLLIVGGGAHRTGKQGGGWQAIRRFAREQYPDAQERYRWAAQDCMSLDGAPYIGHYAKGKRDLYVATGYNKWGFTSSMVAADQITKMILGQDTPCAPAFEPSRSILHRQLAVNMGESVLHLIKPTVPRCSHLGCALEWNRREHCWDCPCHGSRFTADGKVLESPATEDLE